MLIVSIHVGKSIRIRRVRVIKIKVIQSGRHGPRRKKTCLREVANNTDADQSAHTCSLISAFVICLSDIIISRLATREISIF